MHLKWRFFFSCHVFTKNEETNLDVAIALFSRLKNNTLKRTGSAFWLFLWVSMTLKATIVAFRPEHLKTDFLRPLPLPPHHLVTKLLLTHNRYIWHFNFPETLDISNPSYSPPTVIFVSFYNHNCSKGDELVKCSFIKLILSQTVTHNYY